MLLSQVTSLGLGISTEIVESPKCVAVVYS